MTNEWNIKYTTTGKKVAVFGNVNTTDYIVQEVLVKNNKEYLSGNNIVASNLHDEPVETWQTHRVKELESTIRSLETKRDLLNKEIGSVSKFKNAMDSRIDWIKGITEQEVIDCVNNIKSFVLFEYTHVVFTGYQPRIEEINQSTFLNGDNEIRLVSLFGKWNKRLDMNWKVNTYRDGSGSNETIFICKSIEEAKKSLFDYINSQNYFGDDHYNLCLKYNLPIPEEKNKIRIENNIKNYSEHLRKKQEELQQAQDKLKSYQDQL